MKEIDKIIKSKYPPKDKNVLWDNGENLMINRNGKWESTGGGVPMLNIKYTELVNLRNNSKLISGQQYRITNYVTTTAQANTRSAGHQFDVIVTADDEKTLNEVARACLHEGDTYFTEANANLAAWKIWYSLDNDAERFAWADEENGKGVIYRMIDEWNNDVPYDFKNIIYVFNKSFMYNQWGKTSEFIRDQSIDKVIDGIQYYGYITDNLPSAWSQGKCWVTDENVTTNSQLYNEDGSQISYGGTIFGINNMVYELYTFNEGVLNDFSLDGEFCHENTILTWTGGLNKIIFKNDKTDSYYNCHSNSFGANCYSNSFGANCYSNSFGNRCHNNSFDYNCYYNSFGAGCCYNSFDYDCYSNTFSNDCHSNSFGDHCYYNDFGNNCNTNSFGNSCNTNSFGNDCANNSFGSSNARNSFGNSCSNNSFGFACDTNSFGSNCYINSFGNNCTSNSFDNGCHSNKFGSSCSYNSFGNDCHSNSFAFATDTAGDYFCANSLGDGVQYVTLQNDLNASISTMVQYYKVANGTHGTLDSQLVIEVTCRKLVETYIGMNSSGEVKQVCLADLA